MSFKTFKVKKNRHYSRPRRFKIYRKPRTLKTTVIFNRDCDYDLVDQDQKDWNKLTGLTYSFNPLSETVMIGWRYNRDTELIELGGYYHVEKGRHFTEPLLSVRLGSIVETYIEVDYSKKTYTVRLKSEDNEVSHTYSFTHNRTWARRINLWFGGNEKAPQTISIKMDFKKD